MGVFDEADTTTYTLTPELLDDTFFLFNVSSTLLRPRGPFTGGARASWTNTNTGWKVPGVVNWGLTTTTPAGDVVLTANYDAFRSVMDAVNPGSWLSGDVVPLSAAREPDKCDAGAVEMRNRTVTAYADKQVTVTLATEWALPTRPAGLDALVSTGAGGKRGQMVDVTVTTLGYKVMDSKGAEVTSVVLRPSSSASRTTTSTSGPTSRPPSASASAGLSTGAKAGIGAGVGVGGLAVISLAAFFLLRRRKRNRKVVPEDEKSKVSPPTDSDDGYQKAELGTGPGVEKYTAELAAHEPRELGNTERKFEMNGGRGQEAVELPAEERPVEVSGGNAR
jgi:hypothetical protein